MSWDDPLTERQRQIITALKNQLGYSVLEDDFNVNRAKARNQINELYRQRWRIRGK